MNATTEIENATTPSAEVECCVKCCVEEPAAGKFDGWLFCECVGNYCGDCSPTNNCPNYPDCDCECEMCAVEEDEEEELICCLCNEEIYGYGNNPSPVKEDGKCCDKCNMGVVIPARINEARRR